MLKLKKCDFSLSRILIGNEIFGSFFGKKEQEKTAHNTQKNKS